MYHRNYTTYLQKELDFLKLLVSRFHEQEKVNGLELDVALQKTQEVYEQLLRIKVIPENGDEKEAPVEVSVPKKKVVEQEPKIIKEEPIPVREVIQPETLNSKPEILAEKISPSDFHHINETLAQQKTGNDLSSKLQTKPLSSIPSGIGLNDKFLFIRELFKGDNILYNNTIQLLDQSDSLANALGYIQHHFDWDEKNETAQKLINLVHRRHGNK
jgi:hypothetical protein